jgi:hypothetical protein
VTLVKVFVTRGVTALPLKENLIPRFAEGEGAQENDEERLDVEKENEISRQLKRAIFPASNAAVPSVCGRQNTL